MESRPFRSWDDVRRIEGLTDAIVREMAQYGVELGDPAQADIKRISDEHRWRDQRAATAGSDIEEGVPTDARRSANTRQS